VECFQQIRARLGAASDVKFSNEYGIDGGMMEARIFADLARCLVIGKPFTTPEMTGVKLPVVCGVMSGTGYMTQNLKDWIAAHGTNPPISATKWSRAAAQALAA